MVKELLLEQNDMDLESKDKDGRTALLCAAGDWVKFKDFARRVDLQYDGRATVARLLLVRDDVKPDSSPGLGDAL